MLSRGSANSQPRLTQKETAAFKDRGQLEVQLKSGSRLQGRERSYRMAAAAAMAPPAIPKSPARRPPETPGGLALVTEGRSGPYQLSC